MARGIVGDRNGRPKIASPLYKQSYFLDTGESVEAGGPALACYPCRVRGGRVEVIPESLPAAQATAGSQAA
jgi:nitrite reductase (NADH) small subunit